ncbi:MAG: multidrug efflux RND transporter permease subunit [Firmicutes bacterium]|nr:multidrug efflux RND transporter permease subunit [Bacillota bacterium]
MAKFFIHRPVFAIVIAIVIMLTGILSMMFLPIAQFPTITPPTVQVTINYPGANAKTVEEAIGIPLEEQINGADNLIYMSSNSTNDGKYSLTCTFAVGTDPDMASVDINNRVSKAQAKLPADAVSQGITVRKRNPSMLMIISLYSPTRVYDSTFLSNYASIRLLNSINRIKGVGDTTISGQRDYSMRIWVDPEKLNKMGVTAGDLVSVVNEQNTLSPAGAVGQPPSEPGTSFQYMVKADGRLQTEGEFSNLIIRTQTDGSILRIRDVARVSLEAQSYSSYGKLNDYPAVNLIIYQSPDANAIETANLLKKHLAKMQSEMPPGLEGKITLDTTQYVKDSIEKVKETLRDAILLVLIVVFIFLGSFRATIIPMLAVPVSLIGTFTAFMALGFSINTLTLFGIVLAVGIVVDDAIVVVEAANRHIEEGLDPTSATEKAMDEVSAPVIAIALVLCAVFVPVAFISGITGQLYRQFALTLSVSVILSAIVALTLTPALCAMILRHNVKKKGIFYFFANKFNQLFAWVTKIYTLIVKVIVGRLFFAFLLLMVVWFFTGKLFTEMRTGFIPSEDQGYFTTTITLPDGASLERTEQITTKIQKYISSLPGVDLVTVNGGSNMLNNTVNSNTSSIITRLKPWDERKTPDTNIETIMGKVRKEMDSYPEILGVVVLPVPIRGMGGSGGVQFELQDRSGHTLEELDLTARDFMAEASKMPEFSNVYSGYRTTVPQINFELNRDKAKELDVNVNSVFQSLQIFLGGSPVSDFNLFDRTYKVNIQAEPEFRMNSESINRIFVRSTTGNMIPMGSIADLQMGAGPTVVQRYNTYKTAEITAAPAPGYSSGQIIKTLEQLAADKLPEGYGYEWTGTAYQEKLSGSTQILIFALSITFVFLFLAALYESCAIPFSILLGLPLGIFGALLATQLSGLENNVYTQIGIVMIMGLAAKNAILIVEFAKMRHERDGMSLVEAAVEGAKTRFRPILMTSFAFIFGVLPLVTSTGVGAASRKALGTAVFGGMISATCLGVFFIPMLYVMVQGVVNRFFGKKPKTAPEAPPAETKETPAAENEGKNE